MANRDAAHGGFVVSDRALEGAPIGRTWRERSRIPQLNGWTVCSVADDDDYVSEPANFQVVSASSLLACSPLAGALLEVFDAPCGTDLAWAYEEGVLTGFWDVARDRATTVPGILGGGQAV